MLLKKPNRLAKLHIPGPSHYESVRRAWPYYVVNSSKDPPNSNVFFAACSVDFWSLRNLCRKNK